MKELTQMMIENNFLFNRKQAFKNFKYIIVITEEKALTGGTSWEGKISYLKKFVDNSIGMNDKALEKMERNINLRVERFYKETMTGLDAMDRSVQEILKN